MNKILLSALLLIFGIHVSYGQTTSDFESFDLPPESFLNGSDGSGGFTDGNIRLLNDFNDAYGSWSGWSISSTTDVETPGFVNQYSCIAGSGVDGSPTYATTFVSGESLLHTVGDGRGVIEGFYINNSTYAALSMRDGDAFAKRFGGEDGTDPDFLFVSIKEYGSRNVNNDSIVFYLADYRFDNSQDDYILDEWTYIDLTQFGNVDTLSFQLFSSDVGQFGINTPAYFCIDNIITRDLSLTSTNELEEITSRISVYPNPSHGDIWIENKEAFTEYEIVDILGRQLADGPLIDGLQQLQIGDLGSGRYFLHLRKANNVQAIQTLILH